MLLHDWYKEKFTRLKSTNIGDLILGSGINSVAKVTAAGLGFIGSMLIARFYSAETLGQIATISSTFAMLSLFALVGNHTYLLRTIPQKIASSGFLHARRVFLKIVSLVLISNVFVIAVLFFTLITFKAVSYTHLTLPTIYSV